MSNQLTCFDFDGAAVRVVQRDGQPWFVAADVCRAIEIGNSRDAVSGLDEDEKTTVGNPDSRPGKPGAKAFQVVSESGLYALIFKSRKPEARKFCKWVTSEVLPALRKTGAYVATVECAVNDTRRADLLNDVGVTIKRLHYAMWACEDRRMSQESGRVIAALAGRKLEAIRIGMDLLGLPNSEQMKLAGLTLVG